jgi:hypothetical protein
VNLYSCSGFRSVRSDDIREAAKIFALRSARRSFGRSGRVGPLNAECWTRDGRVVEFSAFIGYRVPGRPNELSGRNVRFTVINGGAL